MPHKYKSMDLNDGPVRLKNPHAVALGRLGGLRGGRAGGLKGGPARAKKLSAKRRSEIAKLAAKVRWSKIKNNVKGIAS